MKQSRGRGGSLNATEGLLSLQIRISGPMTPGKYGDICKELLCKGAACSTEEMLLKKLTTQYPLLSCRILS